MASKAYGLAAFMDGFLQGGRFTLAARDKLGEIEDARDARKQRRRIETANAKRREQAKKKVADKYAKPIAPQQESALPAEGDVNKPISPPEKTDEEKLKGDTIAEKLKALGGDTPDNEQGYSAAGEAIPTSEGKEKIPDKVPADDSLSTPAGEPELTVEALETTEPVITSSNVPTTFSRKEYEMAAIDALPADMDWKDWREYELNGINQSRQEVVAGLANFTEMQKAIDAMPEGPDKINAQNAARMQLADIVTALPNGQNARVERVGDKYVLQLYSENDPEIKTGTMIVNAKNAQQMLDHFTGPDGIKNYGDWDLTMQKKASDIHRADELHKWVKLEHEQKAYSRSLQDYLDVEGAKTDRYKAVSENVQEARLGNHHTAKSQQAAIDDFVDFTKATRTSHQSRMNKMWEKGAQRRWEIENLRDGFDKEVFDKWVLEGIPVDNASMDALYLNTPAYTDALQTARSIIAHEPNASPTVVMNKLAMEYVQMGKAEKEIAKNGITGAKDQQKVRDNYRRQFSDENGDLVIIYDGKGNGVKSEVSRYRVPPQRSRPSVQRQYYHKMFGGKANMDGLNIKLVSLKTPTGETILQPALKGYSKKQVEADVAENKERAKAQRVQRTQGTAVPKETPTQSAAPTAAIPAEAAPGLPPTPEAHAADTRPAPVPPEDILVEPEEDRPSMWDKLSEPGRKLGTALADREEEFQTAKAVRNELQGYMDRLADKTLSVDEARAVYNKLFDDEAYGYVVKDPEFRRLREELKRRIGRSLNARRALSGQQSLAPQ